MPYIRTIAPDEATGSVKKQYDAAMKRAGRIYNVVRIQSLNPRTMDASLRLYMSTSGGMASTGGAGGSGGAGGASCLTCSSVLSSLDSASFPDVCGFQGDDGMGNIICDAGSSCELMDAFFRCACGTTCNAECASNACLSMASTAECTACTDASCTFESMACNGDT